MSALLLTAFFDTVLFSVECVGVVPELISYVNIVWMLLMCVGFAYFVYFSLYYFILLLKKTRCSFPFSKATRFLLDIFYRR